MKAILGCTRLKFINGYVTHFMKRLAHTRTEPKEVRIPVPYGHIAGRLWNESRTAIPFICLHGWKDNAASFDKLIPLLLQGSTKYQYLCIDLPGHGFSSHYPPGMLYQTVDIMLAIRRVARHFGWSEARGLHILGHSLGAILGFVFAANHPAICECLIAIDGLVPVVFTRADVLNMINIITESILQMESGEYTKTLSRTFTKEELFQRMLNSHMLGLHLTACEALFTRNIVESSPNSGKYRFSHDPRVQFLPLMGYSPGQIRYQASAFKSTLLHIKAENGVNYISDYMQANIKRWLAQDNNKLMRFVSVKKAPHHVHLTDPERIASEILTFLSAAY